MQEQLLLSTLVPYGERLPKRTGAGSLQQVLSARDGLVTDLVQAPVSNKLVAFFEIPIFKDGRPTYVMSISLLPTGSTTWSKTALRLDLYLVNSVRKRTGVRREPTRH
jgi:hypothetical protein